MAKSALRIRFVFGHQGASRAAESTSRQRFANKFAAVVVEDFAFRYAEDSYADLVGKIATGFERDVRRELVHMAALFREHITGAAGSGTSPAGNLTTVGSNDFGYDVPIRQSIPSWAPRSAKYLAYKQKKIGHRRWFESSGLLKKSTSADAWLKSFGPISVSITRNLPATAAARRPGALTKRVFQTEPGHTKLNIATVRVFALSYITPAMLPGLASGDPEAMNSDQGNPGLMGLVAANDPEIAYRLGRRSGADSGSLYRPTLEPFLAYFLTVAVPAAVQNRLATNKLSPGRSSGGRNG